METPNESTAPVGGTDGRCRRMSTEVHDDLHFLDAADSWESDVYEEPLLNSLQASRGGIHGNHYNNKMKKSDRRTFIDATTPTLEDEDVLGAGEEDDGVDDEDEEEMISLEQERLRRGRLHQQLHHGHHHHSSKEDDHLASLRRTPGASQMHQSSHRAEELLGFGLALTTPIGASKNKQHQHQHHSQSGGGHIDHHALDEDDSPSMVRRSPASRPPRDPKREDASYTPASFALTKNPHIQVSHGAFSPNTLRLTEDLDNLLDEEEEDDAELSRHQVFRDQVDSTVGTATTGTESWTSSYIFESEGGTAERSRMGSKNRNNRRGSGRRSRNSESPRAYTPKQQHQQQQQQQHQHHFQQQQQQHLHHDPYHHQHPHPHHQQHQFLSAQHPTPVRGEVTYRGDIVMNDQVPQPLNFGGAFAPPSKSGIYQRPVPSNDPTPFSSFSTPFVPSQQPPPQELQQHHVPHQQQQGTFSPAAFHHPDPRIGGMGGYSPNMYGHHALDAMQRPLPIGMQPMGNNYDRSRMGAGSNFVPPTTYGMQQGWAPQQHQQHPQQPVMMPPPAYRMAQQPPPPQQSPRGWQHQPPSPMVESPWMDTSFTSYALPPVNRMSPNLQLAGYTQQHLQQQPIWSQEAALAAAHSNRVAGSPTFAPDADHQFEFTSVTPTTPATEEAVFDDAASSRLNRKDSRNSKRNNDKKQPVSNKSASAVSGKGDKSSRSKKQSGQRASSPSSTKGNVKRGGGAAGGKGRKTESPTEPENPEDAKRAELVESPETRAAFKEFYRQFRLKERSSIKEAEDYALRTLKYGSIPEKTHWRVYLELADLAKRSNKFEDARKLYSLVCELQPYANQGWLEFSKLEEECGHMNRCAKILHEGLKYCTISENLLTRAIKHEEKRNNHIRARELLARLKHVGIEKVWRTVLEGALLEARAGNHPMARRVLKYLMHHVPWYGPLYLEAYRLERDLGRPKDALSIVEKGLKAIPRYGPLWFGAFRLCETLDFNDKNYDLPLTIRMFERATNTISRELVWKVHLDASQILERAALALATSTPGMTVDRALADCRKRVAMTALSCPSNLSWKVWLAGGRMELSAGNIEIARKLFLRAHKVVPVKGRIATLLECARLEEFAGDVDLARAILCKSRKELNTDWKVWLESVLLEARDGEHVRALDLAKQALDKHSGTGRLWACLVQLRYVEGGEAAQYSSLKNALRSVPKSGEVWCEGGRIHLNPFSTLFSLSEARRHLFFATRFTPQYGDGFLETLRLEILERWVLPMASCVWEAIQPLFADQTEDVDLWISSLVVAAVKLVRMSSGGGACDDFEEESFDKSVIPSLRAQLEATNLDELFETSTLELRCANADPNYGSMWFKCRNAPTDTARVVLRRARWLIVADVKDHAHIYIAAIIRRCGLMAALKQKQEIDQMNEQTPHSEIETNGLAMTTASIETILKSEVNGVPDHTVLLENTVSGFRFASGLVVLNEHLPLKDMPSLERKKALFGSDALFS
jgi:tetratricopeptide (TPR) repeat protein